MEVVSFCECVLVTVGEMSCVGYMGAWNMHAPCLFTLGRFLSLLKKTSLFSPGRPPRFPPYARFGTGSGGLTWRTSTTWYPGTRGRRRSASTTPGTWRTTCRRESVPAGLGVVVVSATRLSNPVQSQSKLVSIYPAPSDNKKFLRCPSC